MHKAVKHLTLLVQYDTDNMIRSTIGFSPYMKYMHVKYMFLILFKRTEHMNPFKGHRVQREITRLRGSSFALSYHIIQTNNGFCCAVLQIYNKIQYYIFLRLEKTIYYIYYIPIKVELAADALQNIL